MPRSASKHAATLVSAQPWAITPESMLRSIQLPAVWCLPPPPPRCVVLTSAVGLHAVCSACIRQNLNFQERSGSPACPVCRAPCDNRDLQANLSLRELVEGYAAARPALLRLLRSTEQQLAAASRQQPRRRVGKRAAAAEPEAELEEDGEGRGAAEVAPRRSFRRSTAAAAAAAADTAGPAARRPESQAGQATQRLDLRADCSEQVAAAVAPRRRLRSRAYADALPASAAEVIGDSDCEESPPAQQQSDDADGQPESDYCIEVLDSGSDGAALSSGEEFAASEREDSEASEGLLSSPSPPDKRRRRSRSQSQRGDARRQSMQQRQGKGRGSEAAAGGGGHSQGATDAPPVRPLLVVVVVVGAPFPFIGQCCLWIAFSRKAFLWIRF